MEFDWHEKKRKSNIKKHKVDFVYAAGIFENEVLTRIDDRADYGEERLISLGMIDDECFIVVYTERGNVTRLISAWKGGRDERSDYEAGVARGHQKDEGSR